MNRANPSLLSLNPIQHHLNRFSTQIHSQAPKRISPSFKPGPFRGALLAKEPGNTQDEQQKQTPIQHEYSASQLLRSTISSSSTTNTPRNSSSSSRLHFPHSKLIKQHLEELLYPLSFSDQLACRIVSAKNLIKSQDSLDSLEQQTEGGVGFARLGEHNTKLSFIGRRAMHFALSNFLLHAPRSSSSSTPASPSSPSDDHHSKRTGKSTSEVVEDALLTKFVLGQYVGHQWELEKIMRWRELSPPPSKQPSSSGEETQPRVMHGTGLWMARGHVVEAIVGAVMAEHGTRLSMAVFHSLVLPHLSFRLDRALLPAIKAVQTHDQELENPSAGLVDWKSLNLDPFLDHQDHPATTSTTSSFSRPAPIAAVG
ncbi:uncharacterized protein PGTG_01533 [Puccinia graminis f. sp. tritici CRL 75-36-700-3]|uniref:Uncharacterized protein n=1 Tax=Puccinia graminis f. sp. tritici (strain CRL 75-36-700-3 / race SCCL) TaxID=418459 RepID=E3JSG7_PUCGT|nr:uncharacterized protein PGTG_01533 [Puccinia graminis f. sp. tritici CRL 75-36-700-3]EFP74940.1 hypothetical protein PGTG_01533 [Puccinia graminis f. sp. tritici CRL 75-36-700-3]